MTTTDQAITAMHAGNLKFWLESEAAKTGDDNQQQRFDAGLLPEDELLALARAVLFAPFAAIVGLQRWNSRVDRAAMHRGLKWLCLHGDKRDAHEKTGSYEYEVTTAAEVGPDEWDRLAGLRSLTAKINPHPWMTRGGGAAQVDILTHWCTCTVCKEETFANVAKVRILWAGRELVREYRL